MPYTRTVQTFTWIIFSQFRRDCSHPYSGIGEIPTKDQDYARSPRDTLEDQVSRLYYGFEQQLHLKNTAKRYSTYTAVNTV